MHQVSITIEGYSAAEAMPTDPKRAVAKIWLFMILMMF
jgi:hypothetical protein